MAGQHRNIIRQPRRSRNDSLTTWAFAAEVLVIALVWSGCLGLLVNAQDWSEMNFLFISILAVIASGIVPRIRGRIRGLVPPEEPTTGTGRQAPNTGTVDITRLRLELDDRHRTARTT
jgi:hypothetical protein